MDPITIIVGALVVGAKTGLTDVAGQAIKESYAGLKTLIKDRYQRAPVEMLESEPDDKGRQAILQQDLAKVGADKDPEVLEEAKKVLEAVEKQEPGGVKSIVGLEMNKVRAVNLRVGKVMAEGDGVIINESEFSGDIELNEIQAVVNKNPPER